MSLKYVGNLSYWCLVEGTGAVVKPPLAEISNTHTVICPIFHPLKLKNVQQCKHKTDCYTKTKMPD